MEYAEAPIFSRTHSDPKMKLEALMFLKTVVNDFQLVVTQIFTEHAAQSVDALRTLAKVQINYAAYAQKGATTTTTNFCSFLHYRDTHSRSLCRLYR